MKRTVLLAAAILIPISAWAQEDDAFESLRFMVRPGATLTVLNAQGESISGRVESLSRTSLRLSTRSGTREFTRQDIEAIQRQYKDPVKDGATKGFIVGAALGLAMGFAADGPEKNPVGAAAIAGIYGAGIGMIADAFKKTTETIYSAPGRPTQTRLRVAPFASSQGKGVRLGLSF